MSLLIPKKKLVNTALFTAVLIGILVIMPHLFGPRIIYTNSSPQGVLFLMLAIILIWIVNLTLFFVEQGVNGKAPPYIRYIASYAICVAVVLSVRLLLMSFVPDGGFPTGKIDFSKQANGAKVLVRPYSDDGTQKLMRGNPMELGRWAGPLYISAVWGVALNTLVLLIQDLVLLREKKTRIELENADLKVKNAEATNQRLMQQIHPHFLFNSLNTLKTLIKRSPDMAEDYLVKLSDFLRASLLSTTINTVRLEEELKHCLDYLDMQKMRFGEALRYTVVIPDEIQHTVSVPVFSLLPLLENAIKHNILTEKSPLEIEITFVNGAVITTNNMQPKTQRDESTGVGLENLAERYRILSGDGVVIANDGKTFSVSIKALP